MSTTVRRCAVILAALATLFQTGRVLDAQAPPAANRMTGGSAGVLFDNNTILSEIGLASSSNVHFRNNLVLGEQSVPTLFVVNTLTNDSSSDHNGFRPNPGAAVSFAWNSPPPDRQADYAGPMTPAPDLGALDLNAPLPHDGPQR